MAAVGTAPVAAAGAAPREVSGSDKGLAEAIADGTVPAPALMGFNDWQKWRKTSFTRPLVGRGDPVTSTSTQEVALWKSTMEELYGDTWRDDLAELEAAVAAEVSDEDQAATVGGAGPSGPRAEGLAGGAAVPKVRSVVPPRVAGHDTPGGRSAGSGSAGSRAELPTAAKLWEGLQQEYDPQREERSVWQARVLEAVGRLTAMGFVVPESEMEKTIRKAGYAEHISEMTLAEQVAYLKNTFGQVLLNEENFGEAEYAARLEAMMDMLRARGSALSRSAARMFSGSDAKPSPERPGRDDNLRDEGGGLAGIATPARETGAGGRRPEVRLHTPPRRAADRTLEQEVAHLRAKLQEAEAPRLPGGAAENALAKAIELQTEAIALALKSKEVRHSTIKVSPTFKWPTLGDDGPDAKEVEEFYEKYEDLCRLANDGRGMSSLEHLTTLVSCLRGSKEKIYRTVYKKHRKLGTIEKDPGAVYAEVRERHMRFIETPMEKQMRVLGEWDGLWKGNKTALQFEAAFEESITELELAGLAKNERELLLGYLQKIGPQVATEVQKDVRTWTDRAGKEVSRRACSWEEAHRIHVELEAIKASGRALVPAYALYGKGGGKGGKPPGAAGDGGGGEKAVCHEMRDKGTCRFGESCRYSHDPQALAAARKVAKSQAAAGAKLDAALLDPAKGKAKGKGKEKGKVKAKGKGDSKGSGKPPGMSKVEFPDRFCPDLRKGQVCRYGKDCRFSHEKKRFDADGKLKVKGAAKIEKAAAKAAEEEVDWEPPGGLPTPKKGTMVSQRGSAPNPFGFPLWLGKVGQCEPAYAATELAAVAGKVERTVHKGIKFLKDLPARWWIEAVSDLGGYQWITTMSVLEKAVRVLLDSGAAINAVTEEFVVGLLNHCARLGITSKDPQYPVLQLEKWPAKEKVSGVAKDTPVHLVGAVVLKIRLGVAGRQPAPEVPIRFKIFGAGTCDWHGLILGGRTLDTTAKGGLGLRVTPDAYVLDGPGVILPRDEEGGYDRPDAAYGMQRPFVASVAPCMHLRSVFDSDSDGEEEGAEAFSPCTGTLLFVGETLSLAPDEGAWIPVRRTQPPGVAEAAGCDVEVVLPSPGLAVEVVPGLWSTGSVEGLVFVGNATDFDQCLEKGDRVGGVARAAVQTRVCGECRAEDSEAWVVAPGQAGCKSCGAHVKKVALNCRQCGAAGAQVSLMQYAGCGSCAAPSRSETRRQAVWSIQRALPVEEKLWTLKVESRKEAVDTVRNPVFHIVEEPGGIDRMTEVEIPPEYYYQKLREDLGRRHSAAEWHVLDHLVSLEAFLDVSIRAGFSYGVDKAKVLVASGKLLGRIVSRDGTSADDERSQAVRDFAPLRTKQQVQQFAGSTNWLRQHMSVEYAQALKVLGEFLKPGAEFPTAGLGVGNEPGDKAVKAIKIMASNLIRLSVLDEAAAMDGSRPLEQIADSSGIAWGGTCLQMTRDLMGFNVLMTASKGLTPSQQAWPPLTLEGYAQLETKRAQKKFLGAMKSLCWTDHANWTRQLVLEDVDVKHLRWVSFLVADGSQIRSLSGRSAKLGDGYSRNPKDRDALVEQRTRDLEGRMGQLRGFSLDAFLADHAEGEKSFPWSIGDDAIPDKIEETDAVAQMVAELAASAGVLPVLRAALVMDYYDIDTGRKRAEELEAILRTLVAGRWVKVYPIPGAFEDDLGTPAQFAVQSNLPRQKKLLAIRRDFLTAIANASRKVAFWGPDVIIGEGQGGLVALGLARPLILEAALQARNVQRNEAQSIAEAWGAMHAVVILRPRWSKRDLGLKELLEAMPELKAPFARESKYTVLVRDRESTMHQKEGELRKELGLEEAAGLGDVQWLTLLGLPRSVMFDHGGLCQCGRRTYLFGQCVRCIAAEGKDTVGEMLEGAKETPDERDSGPGVVASDCGTIEASRRGPEDSVRLLTKAQVVAALRVSRVSAPPTGDFIQVRRWKTSLALTLDGARDPGRPFRWVGMVSSIGVVSEVQSCVRVAAESLHVFKGAVRRSGEGPPANAVATEAFGEAIRGLKDLPRSRRFWIWQKDRKEVGPGGEELLAYFGPATEVKALALVRLPEKGADEFVRRLPKHGEAPLERLAVWADGGCVPAPPHLDGVEWALAVYGAAREAEVDLVTIRSAQWVHYDPSGRLEVADRGVKADVEEAGAQEGRRAPSCARLGREQCTAAEEEVESPGKEIRWQTPHCFEKDGKLLMDPEARKWLTAQTREREELAEEVRAEAGESRFRVQRTLRAQWMLAQAVDTEVQDLVREENNKSGAYRKSPDDLLVERWMVEPGTGHECWVPVVPQGKIGQLTWRRWTFLQVHVGIFGGHRLADQTVRILHRVAWWPQDRKDIEQWIEHCATCIRFRKRPTKQDSVAVRPVDLECWEEVMVDFEGPSSPADRGGNKYVLTYVCCLCHGVLFEPGVNLTHAEVRRMFARCIFRAGTLPKIVRSDRGPEFRSLLLAEFLALMGVRQTFGTAWRPMEQGIVERCHQELQKVLGMLVVDIVRSFPDEWTELLPVVEFTLYTTPGAHGFSPRDIDRRWSTALPLEKELQPFQISEFEPVNESLRKVFEEYRIIKAKVVGWYASTSAKRAELANRHRKNRTVEVGARVVYRDPRAKAVGGRVAWKEPLSGPCVVEAASGNKLQLRREADHVRLEAHVEDVIVLPPETELLERRPAVEFEEEPAVTRPGEAPRRSIGQMLTADADDGIEDRLVRSAGKLSKVAVGQHIAYALSTRPPPKAAVRACGVGQVKTVVRTGQAEVVLHRYRARADGRLRVHWIGVYLGEDGQEVFGDDPAHHGLRPALEQVAAKRILCVVQLHDGVMSHAAARQLDKAGWTWRQEEIEVAVRVVQQPLEERSRIWAAAQSELNDRLRRETEERFKLVGPRSAARLDFVEIGIGQGELTAQVRKLGFLALDGLNESSLSYGQAWCLEDPSVREQLLWLLCEKVVPRSVHVGLPSVGKGLSSLSPKKHKAAGQCTTFIVALVKALAAKGVAVSLHCPEGASEVRSAEMVELVGRPEQLVPPWRHTLNTGCSFGQVLPVRVDGSGGAIRKGRHWTANWDVTALEVQCGCPRAVHGATHAHVPAFGKVLTVEGRVDAAKCAGVVPVALAEVYAKALRRALGADPVASGPGVAGLSTARTSARASARAQRPPRPMVAAVPGATAESVRHYVLVGGKPEPLDDDHAEVCEAAESPRTRKAREGRLVKEAAEADVKWRALADASDWSGVRADLSVYDYSGQRVDKDPRQEQDYKDRVLEGLGYGREWKAKRPDLSDAAVEAIREVLARKAGAFWLEGSPRTTVRFVQHDTVPVGPPVKLPPHNLKGEAAQWVDEKLEDEVRRGQLERGVSAWGSPPFPTKEAPEHRKQHKRRIVVDYRRVNARTRRAVYYVRPAAGVVAEAAGSIWFSILDAVTGFNHIVNTPRARRMLAIVSRSGQFLPRCLTFGPMNGPEDFCYVVDRFYAPGSRSKRRFCREWLSYVDDQTIRTGRVLDGTWMSDEEHDERLRVAARAADQSAVQSAQEALEAQGFLPHGLGDEVRKTGDRTRQESVKDVPAAEQKSITIIITRGSGSDSGLVVRDQELLYEPGLNRVGLIVPSVALAQNLRGPFRAVAVAQTAAMKAPRRPKPERGRSKERSKELAQRPKQERARSTGSAHHPNLLVAERARAPAQRPRSERAHAKEPAQCATDSISKASAPKLAPPTKILEGSRRAARPASLEDEEDYSYSESQSRSPERGREKAPQRPKAERGREEEPQRPKAERGRSKEPARRSSPKPGRSAEPVRRARPKAVQGDRTPEPVRAGPALEAVAKGAAPKAAKGGAKRVSRWYVLKGSEAQFGSKGVKVRKTKRLLDEVQRWNFEWGDHLKGVNCQDGWFELKEGQYLPMELDGVKILYKDPEELQKKFEKQAKGEWTWIKHQRTPTRSPEGGPGEPQREQKRGRASVPSPPAREASTSPRQRCGAYPRETDGRRASARADLRCESVSRSRSASRPRPLRTPERLPPRLSSARRSPKRSLSSHALGSGHRSPSRSPRRSPRRRPSTREAKSSAEARDVVPPWRRAAVELPRAPAERTSAQGWEQFPEGWDSRKEWTCGRCGGANRHWRKKCFQCSGTADAPPEASGKGARPRKRGRRGGKGRDDRKGEDPAEQGEESEKEDSSAPPGRWRHWRSASRSRSSTKGEKAAEGLGNRAGKACRSPFAHLAQVTAAVASGLIAAAGYEMWHMLRSMREAAGSVVASTAGLVAQLAGALEQVLEQLGISLARLARAMEMTLAGMLPWLAAAVIGVVVAVACMLMGHLWTRGELSDGGQGPRAGSGACRTPFAQAAKAEAPVAKYGKSKEPVNVAAVVAARGRMTALLDKTASAVPAPRAIVAAGRDKSSSASREEDKQDLKKDAEEVRSKLAVLKMKASILRAGTEVQVAGPRAPLGTTEASTQTEDSMLAEVSKELGAARMGVAVSFLDSVMSQDTVVELVSRAVGPVALLAYTFDRPDVAAALSQARSRGLPVSLGADRRFTLSGRCREQEQQLRMLAATGCAVRLLDGGPSGAHYREVGRSQGGLGIAHAKMLITTTADGPVAVIGSCNWTTASRANLETGVLVALSPFGATELWAMVAARLKKGVELLPALRDREVTRSMTPRRAKSQGRSRATSSASQSAAGIPEEDEEEGF